MSPSVLVLELFCRSILDYGYCNFTSSLNVASNHLCLFFSAFGSTITSTNPDMQSKGKEKTKEVNPNGWDVVSIILESEPVKTSVLGQ